MCDSNTSAVNCSRLQNFTTSEPGSGTQSTNEIALPLLQLELAIAGLLLTALLMQCWRLRRYKHHAVVKKLQLRHFRKHNLQKEARKFFGNLSVSRLSLLREAANEYIHDRTFFQTTRSALLWTDDVVILPCLLCRRVWCCSQVREKIFLTDDVPAKQTVIQVELPPSDVMRPTKIVCRCVSLRVSPCSQLRQGKVHAAHLETLFLLIYLSRCCCRLELKIRRALRLFPNQLRRLLPQPSLDRRLAS